ncbi:MAG: hypothetical protein WD491_12910 [Balneolales bacterium]
MKYLILAVLFLQICNASSDQQLQPQHGKVQIANLSSGDEAGLKSIREAFTARNPGYDLNYLKDIREVGPQAYTQVIFVQEIEGVTDQEGLAQATITDHSGFQKESEAIVGDILILHPGEKMQADPEVGLLVFQVPEEPGVELPSFIRPDWDDNITDIPGGCATDIDAFRRILLTW